MNFLEQFIEFPPFPENISPLLVSHTQNLSFRPPLFEMFRNFYSLVQSYVNSNHKYSFWATWQNIWQLSIFQVDQHLLYSIGDLPQTIKVSKLFKSLQRYVCQSVTSTWLTRGRTFSICYLYIINGYITQESRSSDSFKYNLERKIKALNSGNSIHEFWESSILQFLESWICSYWFPSSIS